MPDDADAPEPEGGEPGASRGVFPPPALVAIVGRTNSGKTTFIEKLLPELLALGLRVGAVKHDAHRFEIDREGKDSWRLGRAGALAYAISSADKLAYVARLDRELTLPEIVERFFDGFDLVVAEGYKRSAPNVIEVFRVAAGYEAPVLGPGDWFALVTDAPIEHPRRFGLEDAREVAALIAASLEALRRY